MYRVDIQHLCYDLITIDKQQILKGENSEFLPAFCSLQTAPSDIARNISSLKQFKSNYPPVMQHQTKTSQPVGKSYLRPDAL